METQQPHLQHSDTDGTGPVKRRRPALSCVECRRRKVKCDREKPCGPCTRTRSPTCTYRPSPHTIGRQSKSPTAVSAGQDGSNQVSPQMSSQASDFDSMVNRYIAPGILGPHDGVSQSHLPNLTTKASNSDANTTIKSLADKVRELESKLDSIQVSRPSVNTTLPSRSVTSSTPGQFVKSKFYGESHWMNSIEPYEALGPSFIATNPISNKTEVNKGSDLYFTILECKKLARTVKAARMPHPSPLLDILPSIPPREACDQLVQCYFRTFESVLRVLHVPTFFRDYEEYWKDPPSAKPSVTIKILLVCAIGTTFYTGDEQRRLRSSASQWIQATEYWMSSPHEKSRLNLTGIQIHILLLLARQMCSIDGDLIWMPAGTLLRSAMHCGLHRDPSHFPKISPFHIEMRRRLWATVLEITVQSSLDIGMPPMISSDDFDTLPPSNINDDDIGDGESEPPRPRPLTEFTQTSMQIALNETLPLRLEITRLVNSLRSDISYDDTLRLSGELTNVCRSKALLFQGFLASSHAINQFQVQLIDVLVRRFILALHYPFFAKAKIDPRFYYSRKICLDTALATMNPIPRPEEGQVDDWTSLLINGVGFVKSIFLYCHAAIYLELLDLVKEQRDTVPLASFSTFPSGSTPLSNLPPQFHTLRNVLISAKQMAFARIRNGETNAKGAIFIECVLARIDALVAGRESDDLVLDTARRATAEAAALMRQAYKDEWGVDMDAGLHRDFDVEHGGVDVPISRGGTPGDARRSSWGAESGFEDMDWETLMRDETLDFGFGFEGSPDNWILGGWQGNAGQAEQ